MQGVNWLTRKVITMSPIILTMRQSVDAKTGLTHLDIDSRPESGLPGTTEERVLNWEPVEVDSALFGKLRGRTRWVQPSELVDENEYLTAGLEKDGSDDGRLIQMYTEFLAISAVTTQVCGFETVNGARYHTRRIVARKGDEVVKVRLVYDYLDAGKADGEK